MKASELIYELQKAVSDFGDLEISVFWADHGIAFEGPLICFNPLGSENDAEPGTIDLLIWFDDEDDADSGTI